MQVCQMIAIIFQVATLVCSAPVREWKPTVFAQDVASRGKGPNAQRDTTVHPRLDSVALRHRMKKVFAQDGLASAEAVVDMPVPIGGEGSLKVWAAVVLIIAIAVVPFLFMTCVFVSCCYTRGFVPQDQPRAEPHLTLTSGYFDCLEDKRTCFCACFCPMIRWADTMDQANLLSFWKGFAMWSFVIAVEVVLCLLLFTKIYGTQTLGFLFGHERPGYMAMYWIVIARFVSFQLGRYGMQTLWLLFVIAVFVFRQALRKKLKMPGWQWPTCCWDCLFASCCTCCAIAQEARVVNQAIQAQEEGFAKAPEQITLSA